MSGPPTSSEAQTSAEAAAPGGPLGEALHARSLDCVHCGLCLSSCPTYIETGRETSSPRGRIYLMRGIAEGKVELGSLLAEESFLCLGCRACETACPAGVEYGAMLEVAREAVVRSGRREEPASRLERWLLREIVPRRGRLRVLVGALGLVQWLRLDRLARPFLPPRLREAQALLPTVPARASRAPLPERIPAEGERRGRVALFTGCVMSEMFGDVHRATARVLARNGFDVWVPRTQGCCGALQAHAGDLPLAGSLARSNASAFEAEEIDAIIVNSAGCGAAMRDAEHWIGDAGREYAGRVRDVCEWLDEVGLRPPPPEAQGAQGRLCYDDPCHLVHGQGVQAAPRRLLEALPGLERIEHEGATACCGAAGTYNLTQPAMSRAVLARKLDALEQADPDWIATGNPGCLMQIAAGARERGLRARVVHPVELIDAAYGGAGAASNAGRRS